MWMHAIMYLRVSESVPANICLRHNGSPTHARTGEYLDQKSLADQTWMHMHALHVGV
eukprot:m.943570 g.943570  ORF g.943570 m.943570 type:complete len:57 (+) comp272589_c0_seq1:265-435(+)